MTSDGPLLNLDFEDEETNQNQTKNNKEIIEQQKNNLVSHQSVVIGHAVKKNGHLKTDPDLEDRESVISLSNSSTEEICLVPEVQFEGITLDSGIDRESQPLLGGREHEISCNQFPGK